MLLRIVSDLHLEFDLNYRLSHIDNEKSMILVIAGDLGIAEKPSTYIDFLIDASNRFKHVIYVLGNHEYYHGSILTALDKMKDRAEKYGLSNVHITDCDDFCIDGTVFICSILWSSLNQHDHEAMLAAKSGMSDYYVIRSGHSDDPYYRVLIPEETYELHQQFRGYIDHALYKCKDKKMVVITHHAPSMKSLSPGFERSSLNGAFISDLDDMMIRYSPRMWIHGHTHSSNDYIIGKTRVISNPKGYNGENKEFNDKLVIEV